MSLWTRTAMAMQAAYKAFTDPDSVIRNMSHDQLADIFATRWAYYRSTMFSRRDGADWTLYLKQRELYKHTRLIYNPVPQIVDFYVDNIWQSANNDDYPALVTPLAEGTDESLIKVIALLDMWGNWASESQKIKRYCAGTGNVLVEGVDDMDRQKVTQKAIWPGYVKDPVLNDSGDLQSYTIEHSAWDPQARKHYNFKKIVNKDETRYFRDDKPYKYPGAESDVVEGYGFVFAVWLKHSDDGAVHGSPAGDCYDRVDNINSLASHVDDFCHKGIESPKIIEAESLEALVGCTKNSDGTFTMADVRTEWAAILAKASKDGSVSVHDLSGLLDLAAVSPELARQLERFEKDYPELQAHSLLQNNAQLSGAALERLMTPAQNRLDRAQAGYNNQLIKLRQMQVAVGGFRANGGGWDGTDKQRALFKPFDLDSYAAGKLDFYLKPSVLVRSTETEEIEIEGKRLNNLATKQELGVPTPVLLKEAGYTDEEVTAFDLEDPAVLANQNMQR